eukprot:scaffold10729_cov91-Skeletonema_dohrnii-CCMP3373.AAC.11
MPMFKKPVTSSSPAKGDNAGKPPAGGKDTKRRPNRRKSSGTKDSAGNLRRSSLMCDMMTGDLLADSDDE